MKKEYIAPEITVTLVDIDIITNSVEDADVDLAWWGPTVTMEE